MSSKDVALIMFAVLVINTHLPLPGLNIHSLIPASGLHIVPNQPDLDKIQHNVAHSHISHSTNVPMTVVNAQMGHTSS